jgi:hypothetical protein
MTIVFFQCASQLLSGLRFAGKQLQQHCEFDELAEIVRALNLPPAAYPNIRVSVHEIRPLLGYGSRVRPNRTRKLRVSNTDYSF